MRLADITDAQFAVQSKLYDDKFIWLTVNLATENGNCLKNENEKSSGFTHYVLLLETDVTMQLKIFLLLIKLYILRSGESHAFL